MLGKNKFEDSATKAEKGVPPAPHAPSPPTPIPPYYGSPISSGPMFGSTIYGIHVQNISLIPRIKRCGVLSAVNACLLFIRSMLLFSSYHAAWATLDICLLLLLLACTYSAFYSKRGYLFVALLVVCLITTTTLFASCISIFSLMGRYGENSLPPGWTLQQWQYHGVISWIVFTISLLAIPTFLGEFWYLYKTFPSLSDAPLFSWTPPAPYWQSQHHEFAEGRSGFIANTQGIAFGRSVNFTP